MKITEPVLLAPVLSARTTRLPPPVLVMFGVTRKLKTTSRKAFSVRVVFALQLTGAATMMSPFWPTGLIALLVCNDEVIARELRVQQGVGYRRTGRRRTDTVPDRVVLRIQQQRAGLPVPGARVDVTEEVEVLLARRLDKAAVAELSAAERHDRAGEAQVVVRPQHDLAAIAAVASPRRRWSSAASTLTVVAFGIGIAVKRGALVVDASDGSACRRPSRRRSSPCRRRRGPTRRSSRSANSMFSPVTTILPPLVPFCSPAAESVPETFTVWRGVSAPWCRRSRPRARSGRSSCRPSSPRSRPTY